MRDILLAISLSAFSCWGFAATAEETTAPPSVTVNGCTYAVLDQSAATATLAKVTGVSGDLAILESVEIDGSFYTVTRINPAAFLDYNNVSLDENTIGRLSIPKTITDFGEYGYAIQELSSVESFEVASDNPHLKNIGNTLYSKDGKVLLRYPAKNPAASYAVPEGTEVISRCAFRMARNLSELTFPEGLVEIQEKALEQLSVYKLEFPASLAVFGNVENNNQWCGPCHSCPNLQTVVFKGTGITSIPPYAFFGSSNLKEIAGQGAITEIRPYGLSDCYNLEAVSALGTLDKIGEGAFNHCMKLKHITLSEYLTEIPNEAFASCGIESVNLPAGLQSIGSAAFIACPLSSVVIPDNVTSIGGSAFDCPSLKYFDFGNGIRTIDSELFGDINSYQMTKLTIGSSVESIVSRPFDAILVDEIVCRATTPPAVGIRTFRKQYSNGTILTVPTGCKEVYAQADEWGNFEQIREADLGGIREIAPEEASFRFRPTPEGIVIEGPRAPESKASVYTVDGKPVWSGIPANGLIPVRAAEGMYIIKFGELTAKIAL